MKSHVFRLLPGTDLRKGIEDYAVEHQIKAGCVVSCAGCLSNLCIRLADGASVFQDETDREIVSLSGTLAEQGVHLHIAVADIRGAVIGGHLKYGCAVHTTAEIVLLELEEYRMTREWDEHTGYEELVVHLLSK